MAAIWLCSYCESENHGDAKSCVVCDSHRERIVALPKSDLPSLASLSIPIPIRPFEAPERILPFEAALMARDQEATLSRKSYLTAAVLVVVMSILFGTEWWQIGIWLVLGLVAGSLFADSSAQSSALKDAQAILEISKLAIEKLEKTSLPYQEWDRYQRDYSRALRIETELARSRSNIEANLRDLKERRRNSYVATTLSNVKLAPGVVPGIGDLLTFTLKANGYHSAADINPSVTRITGVGHAKSAALFAWRAKWEKSAVAAFDYSAIRRELESERQVLTRTCEILERDLRRAITVLSTERAAVLSIVELHNNAIKSVNVDYARAKASLELLKPGSTLGIK